MEIKRGTNHAEEDNQCSADSTKVRPNLQRSITRHGFTEAPPKRTLSSRRESSIRADASNSHRMSENDATPAAFTSSCSPESRRMSKRQSLIEAPSHLPRPNVLPSPRHAADALAPRPAPPSTPSLPRLSGVPHSNSNGKKPESRTVGTAVHV